MKRSASSTVDPKSDSTSSSISPSLDSPPPSDHHTQQFASTFTSLYHSIFPPKSSSFPESFSFSLTPSTSSPSSSAAHDFDTEHRLYQARLDTEHRLNQAREVLEFQERIDYYELSLARLQSLTKEIELLRQENAELRLANSNLIKLVNLSSQAAIPHRFSSHEIMEPYRIEKKEEKVTVPRSISVRSSGYLKVTRGSAINGGQSSSSTRPRLTNHLDQLASESVQPRVCVPGGSTREKEAAVEFEVYDQGMWKTELCNKWQETGACPYGENCQFAHGIKELRPVIRHPRYKTQICRMVLAGQVCPYGHRCHFRHSLTHQEELMLMAQR